MFICLHVLINHLKKMHATICDDDKTITENELKWTAKSKRWVKVTD